MNPRVATSPDRFFRAPAPPLRAFVELLWAIDERRISRAVVWTREHVLPTGRMHVVFRLGGNPLRLYDGIEDSRGRLVSDALAGGARATFYVRDVSAPLCSVGAQLRPGAADVLLGAASTDLAARHTPLEDLWGGEVEHVRERLEVARGLRERVDTLEAALLARLGRPRAMHPAVAQALEMFARADRVTDVVRATGVSHRTLIDRFRRAVGLGPKEYCRVLRLQRVLRRLAAGDSLAEVAFASGYSDQAHFTREFQMFCGVSPGEYTRTGPAFPHHLPRTGSRR